LTAGNVGALNFIRPGCMVVAPLHDALKHASNMTQGCLISGDLLSMMYA